MARWVYRCYVMILAGNLWGAPVKILTSFSILGDWVKEIGDTHVQVDSMVGPDTDPHVFSPTPDTIRQIHKADLIFFNGLGLEAWWGRLLKSAQFKGPVVVVTDSMKKAHAHGHCRCGHHDPHDPHIWHSIPQVMEVLPNILKALQAYDPEHKHDYAENFDRYMKRLRKLDEWVRQEIQKVPEPKRTVITAHDAFSYFGHEYGVAFKAPNGLSTDAEPSSKDVAALIDLIRNHHIRALFLENMTNPRIMQQLSKETQVQIVGTLYSDALSIPRGEAPNYMALMRHNVRLMIHAMKLNGTD